MTALNLFLDDLYGDQKILTSGTVPAELVLGAVGYLPKLRGVRPAGGVRVHIGGIDLIRDPSGTFRVLEDNLRTPSGVSYVVENRVISKRVFPRAFDLARVHRVDHYPTRLAETLRPDQVGAMATQTPHGRHLAALPQRQLGRLRGEHGGEEDQGRTQHSAPRTPHPARTPHSARRTRHRTPHPARRTPHAISPLP